MIEFHHRVHHFLHCFVEVFHLVGSQNTADPIEALQGVNIDIRVKFIAHFSSNYFKYGVEIVSNDVGVIFDESSQNEGGDKLGRDEGAHDREAMVIARSAIHHCLVGSSWGLVVEIFLHVPLFCFHGRYTIEETNREDPITLRLINDLFHSVLDFLVLKFPITTHHRVPPKQVMSRVLVEQSDSFSFQCA